MLKWSLLWCVALFAAYGSDTKAVGLARIGTDSQFIVAARLGELEVVEFGPPLHSLVLTGKTHVLEEEMMETFAINTTTPSIKIDEECKE